MTGHNRIKLFNSFSIVVISIGTNLLLIPPYGVMGAAVAAFISIALINLMRLIEVWYLYRILPYNREFLKPVLAGLFALAAIWLTSNWLDGQDAIVFMLVQGLVVLSVYLGSIWLLGLSPDDRVIVDRVNRKTTALYTQGRAILKLR
jgi:O-antigen/teichoic acid export membrane protein